MFTTEYRRMPLRRLWRVTTQVSAAVAVAVFIGVPSVEPPPVQDETVNEITSSTGVSASIIGASTVVLDPLNRVRFRGSSRTAPTREVAGTW